MSKPIFSVVIVTLSLSVLPACGEAADPAAAGPASADGAAAGPAQQESEINARSCDNTQLFLEVGIADDLRQTVAPTFVKEGYYVVVPGAVSAYDSYGGDMVHTVLGTGTSAERVFDVNPGGSFSATVGGFPSGDRFQRRGFSAAQALFDAMTQATESQSTENGWTTRKRVSKKGRVDCQVRTQGGAIRDASCTVRNLLFSRVVSGTTESAIYCVR